MPDYTVERFGTDSSGRPIYMTRYMARWWEAICDDLGFTPTIIQGAFMSRVEGGGADDSAGYHDQGGCLDIRVWDLTSTQQGALVHSTRWGGAGGWIRDEDHGGMDPHFHLILGTDQPLSSGASWQWLNYINGGDGLSGAGRDYHPRPKPLVLEPPESLMGDDMAEYGERILKRLNEIAAAERERDKRRFDALMAAVSALADDAEADADKIRARLRALKAELAELGTEDEPVDP